MFKVRPFCAYTQETDTPKQFAYVGVGGTVRSFGSSTFLGELRCAQDDAQREVAMPRPSGLRQLRSRTGGLSPRSAGGRGSRGVAFSGELWFPAVSRLTNFKPSFYTFVAWLRSPCYLTCIRSVLIG